MGQTFQEWLPSMFSGLEFEISRLHDMVDAEIVKLDKEIQRIDERLKNRGGSNGATD